MKRTTYLIPLLWALEWGACYDPAPGSEPSPLAQHERDARAALSAFALSMTVLLGLRQAKVLS